MAFGCVGWHPDQMVHFALTLGQLSGCGGHGMVVGDEELRVGRPSCSFWTFFSSFLHMSAVSCLATGFPVLACRAPARPVTELPPPIPPFCSMEFPSWQHSQPQQGALVLLEKLQAACNASNCHCSQHILSWSGGPPGSGWLFAGGAPRTLWTYPQTPRPTRVPAACPSTPCTTAPAQPSWLLKVQGG